MEGDQYFIYVLQLENKGFYIGSTKNLISRLKKHFSTGGAIATKESSPKKVLEILKIVDYKYGSQYAHNILEISIAIKYSDMYGAEKVRGAKHGMGWNDTPSKNGLKIINRIRKFMQSEEYQILEEKAKSYKLPEFKDEDYSNLQFLYELK